MLPDVTAVNLPSCVLCGDAATVHWQRRLLPDEIAVQQQIEQERRNEIALLADPQLPAPVFPLLPDCTDWTAVVYTCHAHAIHGHDGAAARIHQGTCTAPDAGDLPGCNCTPEPLPEPEQLAPVQLPPGW